MTGSRKGLGKMALQATIGGLAGFAAAHFGMQSPWIDQLKDDAGALALAGVGMIYLLMGLFVGVANLNPRVGARLLNIADEEEARRERPVTSAGGVVFILFGAAQLLLALAVEGGPVPPVVAISAMVLALTVTALISWLQWPRYDEMLKQVSWESAGISLAVLTVALVGWAMAAQFGGGTAIDPAGLIALLMGVTLAGTFIATARRGMLNPA